MPESKFARVPSAFDPYTDLQQFPLGWNLRNDDGSVYGTEMLDLFGSYYPLWNDGGTYNTIHV
jgi:hypothetical protein